MTTGIIERSPAQIAHDIEKLKDAVDELALKEAAGETISGDEWSLVQAAGVEPREWRKLIERSESLLLHRKNAGSKKDRRQAEKDLEAAKKAVTKQLPEIKEQIEVLESERTAIIAAEVGKQRIVDRQRNAVASLKRCLPARVLSNHQSRTTEIRTRFYKDLGPMDSRLQTIEVMLSQQLGNQSDPENKTRWAVVSYCEREAKECLRPGPSNLSPQIIDEVAWKLHCQLLKAEQDELELRAEPLRKAKAKELAATDKTLDSYIP